MSSGHHVRGTDERASADVVVVTVIIKVLLERNLAERDKGMCGHSVMWTYSK